MKIDNRYGLETAEGIEISLTPAGLGVRSMAFCIDLLIRGAILFAASMLLGAFDKMGSGIFFIMLFLVEWFYPVIFEIVRGATPGKSSYGLMVVYDNGLPVSLPGSLVRNLFRSVDILPFGYLLGAVVMMLSGSSKRIGDYLAGTIVVYKDKSLKTHNLDFNAASTPSLVCDVEQQTAIIAFAERSASFSPQRQQELANILQPILDCKDQAAVDKLTSIAGNLVGKS